MRSVTAERERNVQPASGVRDAERMETRLRCLVQKVRQLAEMVRKTGRPFHLDPMNAYDRRIVHNVFAICNRRPASRSPFGGSGSLSSICRAESPRLVRMKAKTKVVE